MSHIKVYTGYNERTNSRSYRHFEIVSKLPEVEEVFNQGDYKCIEVSPASIDCEQGKDEVYLYDCFIARMVRCDDEDEFWEEYFAIKKEEEQC